MTPIRCPECGKLLGNFAGKGEIKCPRCRKLMKFNTIERLERH